MSLNTTKGFFPSKRLCFLLTSTRVSSTIDGPVGMHATDVSLYGGLDLQAARNLIGRRDCRPNTLPSAPTLTNGLFARWICEIKQEDLQHRRSRGCRLFKKKKTHVNGIIKKKMRVEEKFQHLSNSQGSDASYDPEAGRG